MPPVSAAGDSGFRCRRISCQAAAMAAGSVRWPLGWMVMMSDEQRTHDDVLAVPTDASGAGAGGSSAPEGTGTEADGLGAHATGDDTGDQDSAQAGKQGRRAVPA